MAKLPKAEPMKRSKLKRKPPLRSSRAPFRPDAGKGLRRSRLRRKSNTPAARYYAKVRPDREAWAASVPARCMVCGLDERFCFPGLQTHEIERKSSAPTTWGHRCNYLR